MTRAGPCCGRSRWRITRMAAAADHGRVHPRRCQVRWSQVREDCRPSGGLERRVAARRVFFRAGNGPVHPGRGVPARLLG